MDQKSLWTHNSFWSNICWTNIFLRIKLLLSQNLYLDSYIFRTRIFSGHKIFWNHAFVVPELFFLPFLTWNFLGPMLFGSKNFWSQILLHSTVFWEPRHFFYPESSWQNYFGHTYVGKESDIFAYLTFRYSYLESSRNRKIIFI